ncbi:hypothetical protein PMI21_01913 [Pseudomonas sp. GM18]|uniref:hypothetical protein n=1 Tax=Pseudomonas sp. GM18 TaxID=1144324 RepID=UPI0002722A4C|nr:hypothetical protein [Pseudomonas sp. GM18]EJM18942.1 hypothetical protein PMI21_01913 [Pseudomonas sp. GM18]
MNHPDIAATSDVRFSKPYRIINDPEKNIKSDEIERQRMLTLLKKGIAGANDDDPVYWDGEFITAEKDSSFEQAHQPGAVLLQRMMDKPAFKRILEEHGVNANSEIYIFTDGDIFVSPPGRAGRVTTAIKLDTELNDDFTTLTEIAAAVGGSVSVNNAVGITQWMAFHEYELPEDVKGIKNLIKHLEFEYSPSPPLDNYWGMISALDDQSVVLSPDERNKIRVLTNQFTGRKKKLMTVLGEIALGPQGPTATLLNCRDLLHELGTPPFLQSWSKAYIDALGWYGSNAGEQISDLYAEQLLMTAVILDIYPAAGEDEPRNHVAGYNLYAPENIEKSVPDIIFEFERHLEEKHKVPAYTATLAAYLLMAGKAPEFLVKELPDSLLLGTPEWITFCRGVALAEANAIGSALSMTYSDVMQLEAIEPVNKDLEILHHVLAVDPIIDWALLNSIVTLDSVNSNYPAAVESAIAAYQTFGDLYTQTATTLATPLPSRKAISLEILQHIVPGCDFLEEKILYEKKRGYPGFNSFEPLAMSMVGLNMSNHLGTSNWDLKKGTSIYQSFPRLLPNLVSTEGVFKRRFDQAYAPLAKAMATTVNLVLSALPPIDRVRLLCGEVTLFTIRPSVAFIQPPDLFPQEKQKDKDAATGRYGLVLCSNHEGRLYCYELFTLQGECRENPELAALIQKENSLQQPARLDFTGHINSLSKTASLHTLPTNIERYTHGVPHGVTLSSQGVIDKLGTFPAAEKKSSEIQQSHYKSFYSGQFNSLVDFILKHRPVWTYEELIEDSRGRTELELKLAREEEYFDTFINIIVPFKSCIEDLTSDDPDRNRGSVLSCTIELAINVLLVVGVVAKAVGAVGKAASIGAKSRALAKIGLGFLNSVFNPVDGTPELLYGAGKYLKKGALGIGKLGLHSLENATHQFRKLTGAADSYDLIKAAQRLDVAQGTWRPLDSAVDSFVFAAVRRNDDWYALNRLGQPWGRKLDDFKSTIKFHLPIRYKLMPESYARSVIKEGLPLARKKVESAISILSDTGSNDDANLVLKLLLGDASPQTRNQYLTYLNEVKADFAKVSLSNLIFDGSKNTEALASLNATWYKEWKAASHTEAARKKFIRINIHNFNDNYRKEFFNSGTTADGLVHEMFHGAPDTSDFNYALDPDIYQKGYQQLDVGPLLNLASGHAPAIPGKYPPVYLKSTTALKNADSFAITTSLLSQLATNRPVYLENIKAMQAALDRSRNGYIGVDVLVKLNTV